MRKTVLAAAALVAAAACNPQQAKDETPEGPAVQLYAMDCGHASFPDAGMFASDGSFDGVRRDLVDPCYLIRHPLGDLIWDAGFSDAVHDMAQGLTVPAIGAHVTVPVTLASQLAQLGVAPDEIDFLSFSHSHADHVGNSALFTSATWIVDADERAWMFRDEARRSVEYTSYAHLENAPTRIISGDGDYDVFGDGTVVIMQAPGHTPGHTVLLVRLRNAGPVLLTGDMYHLAESRARRTVPRFNTDAEQTRASMDKVERIAAETGALVIRQHVAEDFAALPRFPEALN